MWLKENHMSLGELALFLRGKYSPSVALRGVGRIFNHQYTIQLEYEKSESWEDVSLKECVKYKRILMSSACIQWTEIVHQGLS